MGRNAFTITRKKKKIKMQDFTMTFEINQKHYSPENLVSSALPITNSKGGKQKNISNLCFLLEG